MALATVVAVGVPFPVARRCREREGKRKGLWLPMRGRQEPALRIVPYPVTPSDLITTGAFGKGDVSVLGCSRAVIFREGTLGRARKRQRCFGQWGNGRKDIAEALTKPLRIRLRNPESGVPIRVAGLRPPMPVPAVAHGEDPPYILGAERQLDGRRTLGVVSTHNGVMEGASMP